MPEEDHKTRVPQPEDVVQLTFHGEEMHLFYLCPGCECSHAIPVNGARNEGGHGWQWDGSYSAPTISPSINASYPGYRCHHFVKAGIMDVLGDSTMNGGKKLPLPPLDR